MSNSSGRSVTSKALQDALERARAAGRDETVVFHLRGQHSSRPPTSEETEHLAAAALHKAIRECGHEPKCKTVFQHLGTMAVQGDPALLLALLKLPEVQQASLNTPPEGKLEPIHPVRKSRPSRKGWVDISS